LLTRTIRSVSHIVRSHFSDPPNNGAIANYSGGTPCPNNNPRGAVRQLYLPEYILDAGRFLVNWCHLTLSQIVKLICDEGQVTPAVKLAKQINCIFTWEIRVLCHHTTKKLVCSAVGIAVMNEQFTDPYLVQVRMSHQYKPIASEERHRRRLDFHHCVRAFYQLCIGNTSFFFFFCCSLSSRYCRFCSVLVLYCALGLVINIKARDKHGREAIPNYEFWAELPFLVKVMFSRTIQRMEIIGVSRFVPHCCCRTEYYSFSADARKRVITDCRPRCPKSPTFILQNSSGFLGLSLALFLTGQLSALRSCIT
jgi:hypothetical protein